MSDGTIQIGIQVENAQALKGLETTRTEVQSVNRELGTQGRESRGAARGMSEYANSSAAAAGASHNLGMGLRQLSSGDLLGGIRSLTTGIKALWASMAANPLGATLAVLGAGMALFTRWRQVTREQKEAQAELNAQLAQNATALQEYRGKVETELDGILQAISRLRLGASALGAGAEWGSILESLDRAAAGIARLRAEAETLADLDLRETLAGISLDESRGNLSPDQASARRRAAQAERDEARRAAREAAAEQRVRLAEEQNGLAELSRRKAEVAKEDAENEAALFRTRFTRAGFGPDLGGESAAMQQQLRGLEGESFKYGRNPDDDPEVIALRRRIALLSELMSQAPQEEQLAARRQEAAEKLLAAEEALIAARQNLEDSLSAQDTEARLSARLAAVQEAERAADAAREAAREQTPAAAAAAPAAAFQQAPTGINVDALARIGQFVGGAGATRPELDLARKTNSILERSEAHLARLASQPPTEATWS